MRKSGLLLAVMTTAVLTSCYYYEGPTPCPAIAQASVVSVAIPVSYVPAGGTLRLKACQDGVCREDAVELRPGSVSVDQGCSPDGVCSATASPDGTLIGMLFLDSLTESSMAVTATGISRDGQSLPVRTLEFRPRGAFPYGEQCGRFVTAAVVLDAKGLREGPA
jgi:hypothetical protein